MNALQALPLLLVAASMPLTAGQWIPTNTGTGGDAEVRESSVTQNRGFSTELGTRVRNDFPLGDPSAGLDRNSVIYTQFDLSGVSMPPDLSSAFRLTYRNSNLTGNRIQDTQTPNPAIRTGLAVYGLEPSRSWNEGTITYLSAPGITYDGDIGTTDFNSDLTFLGTVAFPEIGNQNHLPIGYELRFCSAALNQFIANAYNGGYSSITLVAARIHGGNSPINTWINFNYLFNPKEQTTLNGDFYDPGTGAGQIGNLTSTDNSTGNFSPAIAIFDADELPDGDLCSTYPPPPPPGC